MGRFRKRRQSPAIHVASPSIVTATSTFSLHLFLLRSIISLYNVHSGVGFIDLHTASILR